MAEQSNMRASDADRAQIADHLRRANDEGRLLADEFDGRLGKALRARTYGELDAIVADLPHGRHPAKRRHPAEIALRRRPGLIAMTAAAAATAAVVASLSATGVWTSRPSVRPPIASIPTGITSPRPVQHALNATTGTTVAVSPPPRASYGTTGTTTAASPPSR